MSTLFKNWRLERDTDNVAWLYFDKQNTSTNVLSAEAMAELEQVLDQFNAQNPRGLIILSGKESGFIAGANIEEFAQIKSDDQVIAILKRGWDLFNKLAAVPYPTLALINGFCLGGGLELALACRYRVVVDNPATKLGLPEVMLGIVPGWGGMKRLPEKIGAPAALDLLLTGKSVDARRAKKLGLADECVPPRIMMNTAKMMIMQAPHARRLGFFQNLTNYSLLRPFIAYSARRRVAQSARREHYPAPYSILDTWAYYDGNALAVPAASPASIVSIFKGETVHNLVRIFFLQERLKNLGKEIDFKAKHVHVVGAGIMGGDIAAWCACRGLTVTLQDQSVDKLTPALKRAEELFKKKLKDEKRIRDARDRFIPDVNGEGVKKADVIIEAIFENLEVKQKLFTKLESQARKDALLATNTSSLKLEDIAAPMKNPKRLVGLHFFNPVAQMMLIEIISSENTEKEVAQRAASFSKQIDKLPLPVKSSSGFLVNRVLGPYINQAMRLADEGVSPETIDAAMAKFGMPMGPIELADTVGLDICLAVGKILGAKPPQILTKLIEAGHLGKKTGKGFYFYKNGKPIKTVSGDVTEALIEKLIAPYLNEAQACINEHIVADADLADAGLIFGTGFAPFRGGPMHYLKTANKPELKTALLAQKQA